MLGFVYDAGGPNVDSMEYVHRMKALLDEGWLSIEMVEHTNPYDTWRKIYISHYLTRDWKNIRGALTQVGGMEVKVNF